MNSNQNNPEKTVDKIIKKCWEDASFKQELFENPVKAIERLTGGTFQLGGKKIVAVDQSDPSTIYINIPYNPEDMVLSDAELEVVAGGIHICFPMTLSLIALDT
jgi:hypothetical protein